MLRIRVWDAPTRIAHWLLAATFVVAYLSAEREAWRLVHVRAGYLMLGVLAFRLLWGVWGTRHARFADFTFSARTTFDYLSAMLRGRPPHHTGHNPAGAAAIFLLLGLGVAVTATGVAVYEDWLADFLSPWHEDLSSAMLVVVVVHVAGVIVGSWQHRENLALAMFTGRKLGNEGESIVPGSAAWGAVVLLVLVALALWF